MKTSIDILTAHNWSGERNSFTHKLFKGHSIIVARDKKQWSHFYGREKQRVGASAKDLLKYLTEFHQLQLADQKTVAKVVKKLEKKNAKYEKLAPAIERQLKGQRELAEFRATGKQPKQEHDIKNLTPRVEHGFFLQGPVKFAIDADDIFRTLSCGAFGIGQVRAREGILANLGETELKRWAEVNGLPTKPYAKDLLIEALRGVLQNAFYFAERDGLVPVRCVENQERRMREFYLKFDAFAKTATVKAERLQASLKSNGGQHVFLKKDECTWAATAKLTKKLVAELKGQQQPILEWLLKNKGTRTEIAAAVAAKLTTKQKPELVVGHYLPEWKKKGLISVTP